MPSGQKYEFDEWLLDPAEHLLLRNQKPVPLGPKVFETLLVLVENAGHLVAKDQFMKRVWADTFVEDAALTQNISQLRRVLSKGDCAVIETVPKRGYRLLLPVRVVAEALPVADDFVGGKSSHPQTLIATPSARPAALRRLFTARNALVLGSMASTLAAFFLYYGHSLRSKAGQPSVSFEVTNIGEKHTPSLSPDGQQLAFAWNGGSGTHFSIYLKLVGTEELLRLTKQASIDFNPAWSPDGRNIAFCRIQKGESGIYIIPSLGGAERRVRKTLWEEQEYFETLGSAGRLSWSPDGKLLAFSDRPSRDEQASSIFLLSLDSLEARRLTAAERSGQDLDPVFSPDGQILAFTKQTRPAGGIYTVPVSGGEEQRVLSDGKDHWGVAWTTDGRDIVFATASWPYRIPMAPQNQEITAGWLWKIPLRGGEPERLLFGQEGIEPSIQGNRL